MSLPAVLNEVISVTGVYSFPYDQNPASPPTDQVDGVIPNPIGPVLLFGNALTIGGTASATTGGTGGTAAGGGVRLAAALRQAVRAAAVAAPLLLLSAATRPSTPMPICSRRPIITIYANRISAGVNRSTTTDFAAPAYNVPTFRRQFSTSTTTPARQPSARPITSRSVRSVRRCRRRS